MTPRSPSSLGIEFFLLLLDLPEKQEVALLLHTFMLIKALLVLPPQDTCTSLNFCNHRLQEAFTHPSEELCKHTG